MQTFRNATEVTLQLTLKKGVEKAHDLSSNKRKSMSESKEARNCIRNTEGGEGEVEGEEALGDDKI